MAGRTVLPLVLDVEILKRSVRAPPKYLILPSIVAYQRPQFTDLASRVLLHIQSVMVLRLPPRWLLPGLPHTSIRTIRSLAKKFKPDRFNIGPGLPVLESSKTAALARKEFTTPWRTGVLATKKGMTAVFDPETAVRTPCTVLQLDRVQVVSHKTRPLNGYWAVQIGSGAKQARNVPRPERGHFAANLIPLKRDVVEFKVKDASGLPAIGTQLNADWFLQGQFVDARATSRGMGFEGGMKRWGFSGQPASHGNSLSHRAMGSAGQGQGGGSRVLPGKKMAGNMGNQRHTTQNLKVLRVDPVNGLVVVKGMHGSLSIAYQG